MGELVDLTDLRKARQCRAAAAAVGVRLHPALRWQAGDDTSLAHRRTPMSRAVCGAAGRLLLAEPNTPLCPRCYPLALGVPRRACG